MYLKWGWRKLHFYQNDWFDNDFEIESKYHHKTVVLLLTANILSLQDVVFWSMPFLIFSCVKFNHIKYDTSLATDLGGRLIAMCQISTLGYLPMLLHDSHMMLKIITAFWFGTSEA